MFTNVKVERKYNCLLISNARSANAFQNSSKNIIQLLLRLCPIAMDGFHDILNVFQ